MIKIKIYSTAWCHPCSLAKKLLTDNGLEFEEINIEEAGMSRQDLANITGGMTVPQIVINDINIGGFDKLVAMNQSGELQKIMTS